MLATSRSLSGYVSVGDDMPLQAYQDAAVKLFNASGANYAVVALKYGGAGNLVKTFSSAADARSYFNGFDMSTWAAAVLFDKVTYPPGDPAYNDDFPGSIDLKWNQHVGSETTATSTTITKFKNAAPYLLAAGALVAAVIYLTGDKAKGKRKRLRATWKRRTVSVWR